MVEKLWSSELNEALMEIHFLWIPFEHKGRAGEQRGNNALQGVSGWFVVMEGGNSIIAHEVKAG